MAKKRTSLDSILPPPKSAPTKDAKDSQPDKPITEPNNTHQPSSAKRPRKQLALYLEHAAYQQLRMIAFEEETKMHPLLLEGLDRVFADRGLPSIEELLKDENE